MNDSLFIGVLLPVPTKLVALVLTFENLGGFLDVVLACVESPINDYFFELVSNSYGVLGDKCDFFNGV